MKSNFYKWHRILGMISLVPVIFWTLSGLSHPFMSNWFRPQIAREVFHPLNQQQMAPKLSIQEVMDQNHLNELRNFTLVNFNKQTFYQILNRDSTYQYYSAGDGKLYPNGDKKYAIYLARYFTRDTLSGIKAATIQTRFDGQYQPINRLLPVWKISFDRPDGMDVYIETGQSRMGTFNNNTRKCMLWLFDEFHTWRFLATLGGERLRIVVLIVIVSVMLLSLISGIAVYGLFWNRFKEIRQKRKINGTENKRILHRYHRQIGLWVSFVLFTFVISGGFHLLVKLRNSEAKSPNYGQIIPRAKLQISNLKLPIADSSVIKLQVVAFVDKYYYLIINNKKQILYFSTADAIQLPAGDVCYTMYLAGLYSGRDFEKEMGTPKPVVTLIKQFDNEYGFINKRLPVERITFANGENLYIETTTAKLAAKISDIDRAEGLSFIFLHKYFGMTWAGKNIRDIVSMLAALGVLVVSLFGLLSFVNNKKF